MVLAIPVALAAVLGACGGSTDDAAAAAVASKGAAPAAVAPTGAAAAKGDSWKQHKRFGREFFGAADYISNQPGSGRFGLVANSKAAPLVVSSADHAGVQRVVNDLQADIKRVTRIEPAVHKDTIPAGARDVVIIGTLGKSPLVDRLVQSGKLNVRGIAGRWETHLITQVERPFPGVQRALVIAGSDQRGTIFGAYDVSAQIGVSPWYWWDDVPAKYQSALYVLPGRFSQGEPAVKYRGIFINDEAPQLAGWVPGMFGPAPNPRYSYGFNHLFYERVFEVMLRMKANYIWPAVWGKSLWDDDPQNQDTAVAYGIVLGTSHEAPMMRAQAEWDRFGAAGGPYGGNGSFSFRTNSAALVPYWRDSMVRAGDREKLVTVGMRGNGDTGLEDGFAMELMRSIVDNQRQIIEEVTGKPADQTPQVWTLYKEVQRYWDSGLYAPDDVTIIWCDDNWGNIRKLPDLAAAPRAGGYGVYYHFDYVGGGRNYKWIDTNLVPNIWEQMHMAYRYGVDRVWVVNVGDLKNNELPTQFFLDYAWDPDRWPLEKLGEWERQYAKQNFGAEKASEIAEVLRDYSKLQSDRKPELLNRRISLDPNRNLPTDAGAVVYQDDTPFSLNNYREMERVVEQWQELAQRAEAIGGQLPAEYQDAYYQLVLYAAKATANLYELRLAEFRNIQYAQQGRAAAVDQAAVANARFADDQAMSDYYNNTLAGGKWRGFQSQPKIGYGDVARYGPNASWQQPETNNQADPDFIYPPLRALEVPAGAGLGVAIDGSDRVWPAETTAAVLPTFSPYQSQPTQYIEVFNRGQAPFTYTARASVPWVTVRPASGRVEKQVRATVHVNWSRVPKGTTQVPITVTGSDGTSVVVQAVVENPSVPFWQVEGFVEANGYVSIEAENYTRKVSTRDVGWKHIPDLGRTAGALTPWPPTAPSQVVAGGGRTPRLEYKVHLFTTGPVEVTAYLSPRNNVLHSDGLKYAISFDDAEPQVVNINRLTNNDDTNMNRGWERNTSDNTNRTFTTHVIGQPGEHTLKFWMVDPTVVVQKLVINTGGAKTSYFGPPESFFAGSRGHDRDD